MSEEKSQHFHYSIQAIAANSLLVRFYDSPSQTTLAVPTPNLCEFIHRIKIQLLNNCSESILDIVSAYNSIVVHFNVRLLTLLQISSIVESSITQQLCNKDIQEVSGTTIKIPVYYDEETGPDLQRIANAHNISCEQVIHTHYQQPYMAYAVGFAPGFAYLSFVSENIKMPRRDSPRRFVAAGSIAIADQQTAIYPSDSPGGWNIIGRTPTPMLVKKDNRWGSTIQSGDTVEFFPISREEFLQRGGSL